MIDLINRIEDFLNGRKEVEVEFSEPIVSSNFTYLYKAFFKSNEIWLMDYSEHWYELNPTDSDFNNIAYQLLNRIENE